MGNEPFVHKRRDPNGDPPKYTDARGGDDINFMKMQVSDLKLKLRKGRIHE